MSFETDENGNVRKKEFSKWMYLLPILLTWIGGLIMFFIERKNNPSEAKKGLILGFVLTPVYFVIGGLIELF